MGLPGGRGSPIGRAILCCWVFARRSCLTGLDISLDRLERVFSLGENLVWDIANESVTVARRG
jgi:hypothetical protein